jgi:hypothetical protein
MRSRAARLILSVVSWIALAAAAFFLIQSERHISERRSTLRAFDQHARDAQRVLADVRAGQQAYVAAGQGVDFWMPKVSMLTTDAAQLIDALRAGAASAAARASVMEASAAVTEFGNVDRRAREYLNADLQLMAGDVVFTEGGEITALAARQVEAARLAEHQDVDAGEAAARQREAYAMAGSVGFAALLIGLFAFTPGPQSRRISEAEQRQPAPAADADFPRTTLPALKTAAEVCTELGRVNDPADLRTILGRAADVMDASGLVVWIGDRAGADLRPVLAHGYTPQVVARMPPVARTADNAAASAYRTGALQIVLARPGQSNGALVAPLLTPDGCIGALTAEIRGRGETSDTTQALAAIFAAQLASVLASSAVPTQETESRFASA